MSWNTTQLTRRRPIKRLCNVNHVDYNCLYPISFALNLGKDKCGKVCALHSIRNFKFANVFKCQGSYLSNQTGHFVAIELIWNTAVDIDRHFGLLVALSIRCRDLWLQLFGIFCLEKTWWHKRLQEFSVSDMKKFSPPRLCGSCLYAIFPQYRYQWLRNSSGRVTKQKV